LKESPIFTSIKSAGMTSAQPLKDAFGKWENLKRVLISLLGATAGQGVVWYTGQFYALFYMQTVLKVNARTASIIIAIALVLGMPLFTFFGWLSDKIGRKRIMILEPDRRAHLHPIYKAMEHYAGNNRRDRQVRKEQDTGAIAHTVQP